MERAAERRLAFGTSWRRPPERMMAMVGETFRCRLRTLCLRRYRSWVTSRMMDADFHEVPTPVLSEILGSQQKGTRRRRGRHPAQHGIGPASEVSLCDNALAAIFADY